MPPPSVIRPRRRAGGAMVALALLAAVLDGGCSSGNGFLGPRASVDAYRGLGTWLDVYDRAEWADPAGTVAAMKARGVRTLFLQTSNYSRGKAFVYPTGVGAFVDAAHEAGLAIVAWYLPGFDDLERDYRFSMEAITYRTPSGNGFDSFALDIESSKVKDPALRTQRLMELSVWLREAVGGDYPLGAIIPSPLGMRRRASYWPGFPYLQLALLYDVFLPMTYFTWSTSGERGAHRYTAGDIDLIRRETGNPSEAIHVVGGIAGDATPAETAGFVHAVRDRGVIGASYYTFPVTTGPDWRLLATIPPNPVQVASPSPARASSSSPPSSSPPTS